MKKRENNIGIVAGKASAWASAKNYVVAAALVVVIFLLFGLLTKGDFLRIINLKSVLIHTGVTTCMALAMCFIFATGSLDLSLGSILILGANCSGILAIKFGYVGLLAGGLGSAIIMCVINIKIIQILKIPAWITTLGTAMIYESIMYAYSSAMVARGETVVALRDVCRALGGMPLLFIVEIIAVIIAYILYNRTQSGINIRALGFGTEIASMTGINAKRTQVLSGVFGGIFMGIACVLSISVSSMVASTTGLSSLSSEFQALSVFFMAQAFSSKLNLVPCVFITSLVMMGLLNFLTKIGIPAGTGQQIVLGACIVLFGVISQRGTKEVVK